MASDPEKTDEQLLALIQQGSRSAFAVLVQRHSERFYRLAYRYVQTRETAEDIVQEAFLRLWEDPARFQPERNTKFTTWFYRIVVNLSLDWQKKKRPVELNEDIPVADERPSPGDAMIQNEEQQLLEAAIAALPDRQRTALNLCFAEGVSNREAAEIMGINLKALQSLIMRGKATLKERMKAYL